MNFGQFDTLTEKILPLFVRVSKTRKSLQIQDYVWSNENVVLENVSFVGCWKGSVQPKNA
jgi:hypothetical protein